MSDAIYLTTPVARLVQGDCFKPQTKDKLGNPLISKKTGERAPRFFVGVAVPKGPEWDQLWAQITAKGMIDMPGQASVAGFAWKVVDGDAPEFANKEGFPGHFIIKASSLYPPEVYDDSSPPAQLTDPNSVKCGDYVQVYIRVAGNMSPAQNPGVYINPAKIMRVGYGIAINPGATAQEAFAVRGAVPPGASATPLAPAAPLAHGAPVAVAPAAAAPPAVAVPPAVAAPAAVAAVAVSPAVAVPAAGPPVAIVSTVAPSVAPVAATPPLPGPGAGTVAPITPAPFAVSSPPSVVPAAPTPATGYLDPTKNQ